LGDGLLGEAGAGPVVAQRQQPPVVGQRQGGADVLGQPAELVEQLDADPEMAVRDEEVFAVGEGAPGDVGAGGAAGAGSMSRSSGLDTVRSKE
jgi:hypothetical protein